MAVTDYSTTAADNTSISGIAVRDSTPVDSVDNIIRQLMADVRAFYNSTVLDGATGTFDLSSATLTLPDSSVGIAQIAAAAKSGADATLITGTAGSDGDVATFNGDGDIVGSVRLGMEFIESQDASTSATLDFTGFDATKYDSYLFVLQNIIPSADNTVLWVRTSTDGGSTYDAGASDYAYAGAEFGVSAAANSGEQATSQIQLAAFGGEGVGSDTGEDGISGEVKVFGPHLTKKTIVNYEVGYFTGVGSGRMVKVSGTGARLAQADVDAIRFAFLAGGSTIESGTITMYGLRNA